MLYNIYILNVIIFFSELGGAVGDSTANKKKRENDGTHNEEAANALKLVCRHIGVVEDSPICGICHLVSFYFDTQMNFYKLKNFTKFYTF